MNIDDKEQDLPALRTGDQDLPILIPDSGPHHERAMADTYPGWSNFASQRHIRSLAADPAKGELWLATGGGVLQWIPNRNCFTRYTSEHGLPGNSVVAVAINGNGLVWVSHERYGISYLNGGTWHSYVPLEEIAISCLSRDIFGRIWAGSEQGIYRITHPSDHQATELPLFSGPPRAIAVTDAMMSGYAVPGVYFILNIVIGYAITTGPMFSRCCVNLTTSGWAPLMAFSWST